MASIIEGLKNFFEECPLLGDGGINVNYLGGRGGDYSIEAVPSRPVVKKYVDGGEIRSCSFVFASREFYDEDERQNIETARFYEELEGWIEERNALGRLPLLGEGLVPLKIEVSSSGGFCSASGGTARFQLQGRLIYRKEG